MAEAGFDLKAAPNRHPLESDRLAISQQGKWRFKQALDLGSQVQGSDVMNAMVEVAANMAEANVSPTPALEILTARRNRIPRRGNEDRDRRSFLELGMADIYGMVGETEKMRDLLVRPEDDSSLWTISPYIYAGEAFIRRGDDPTPILDEAMDRVRRSQARYDNHYGKAEKYAHIAVTLHKANLDPSPAFSRAEEQLQEAKAKRSLDTRALESLAQRYSSTGRFEEALATTAYLGVDTNTLPQGQLLDRRQGNGSIEKILMVVLESQFAQGAGDGGIRTAQMFGREPILARAYAHKALQEAKEGRDPSDIIAKTLELTGEVDPSKVYPYQFVLPTVGIALARAGRIEEAAQQFGNIRDAVNLIDVWDRPDVNLALAQAVDDSGHDAEETFRQYFSSVNDFADDQPGLDMWQGIAWDMVRTGIVETAERGYIGLAEEKVDSHEADVWSSSRLLGRLARAEVKYGSIPV